MIYGNQVCCMKLIKYESLTCSVYVLFTGPCCSRKYFIFSRSSRTHFCPYCFCGIKIGACELVGCFKVVLVKIIALTFKNVNLIIHIIIIFDAICIMNSVAMFLQVTWLMVVLKLIWRHMLTGLWWAYFTNSLISSLLIIDIHIRLFCCQILLLLHSASTRRSLNTSIAC